MVAIIRSLLASVIRLPVLFTIAHCDIPCGIYDPHPAQLAASTVRTMVTKIRELEAPAPGTDPSALQAYHNSMTRFIVVKEEHAQLCKKELLVLWTDYFKDQHLKLFPDLHDTLWRAAKLCSVNKQNVDPESAQQLVDATDRIAEMFRIAESRR